MYCNPSRIGKILAFSVSISVDTSRRGDEIDYPTYEEFVEEDRYEKPYLLFVIKDLDGEEVQRIRTSVKTGVNRLTWNMRYPASTPIKLKEGKVGRYSMPSQGPLVLPGKYTVELFQSDNGEIEKIAAPQSFEINALENSSLARQTKENLSFKRELAELRRQFRGTNGSFGELKKRLKYVKAAIINYPGTDMEWMKLVNAIEDSVHAIDIAMWGDSHKSSRDVETLPGTGSRISTIVYQTWYSTSNPTTTQKEQYAIAKEQYAEIKSSVSKVRTAIENLESSLNEQGVPYTPQRKGFKE